MMQNCSPHGSLEGEFISSETAQTVIPRARTHRYPPIKAGSGAGENETKTRGSGAVSRCSISVNPLESIFNHLDRDSQWRGRFEGRRTVPVFTTSVVAPPSGHRSKTPNDYRQHYSNEHRATFDREISVYKANAIEMEPSYILGREKHQYMQHYKIKWD
ncbi:hypothetical protein EVAR_80066_1 [Eumeta japonica]|uniref:Uncharacterized protein n=1 Tax=Eumeta variegata TaxID=151549 RepID=A0A4C1UCJ6_EUMVA|nr:hypothetical protein EVAR_80066_1 [Eumeta japonica]